MDVDAAKMGGPLMETEKEEHCKNNLCFYCHKKGYRSTVCFTKKKQQQGGQVRTTSWSGVTPGETQGGPGNVTPLKLSMEQIRENLKALVDQVKTKGSQEDRELFTQDYIQGIGQDF